MSLEFIILKCIEKRSLEPFLILHLVMLFSFFSPFSSSLCARTHSLVPFSLFGQTHSQYNLIRTFSLNKYLLLREITEKDFFFWSFAANKWFQLFYIIFLFSSSLIAWYIAKYSKMLRSTGSVSTDNERWVFFIHTFYYHIHFVALFIAQNALIVIVMKCLM